MSKSKVVQVSGESRSGKSRKKGRKGRKIGKGINKLSHSRWGSYVALINHQQSLRFERMASRFCKKCHVQFHSKGAYCRHEC